jgi:hypothetical protein
MENGACFGVLDVCFNFAEVLRSAVVQIPDFAARPKSFLFSPTPVPSNAHLRLISELPVCCRMFPNQQSVSSCTGLFASTLT